MRHSHGLAIYVRNCHQVVPIHSISTEQFESLAINVIETHSDTLYSIIVVDKAHDVLSETSKSISCLYHSYNYPRK